MFYETGNYKARECPHLGRVDRWPIAALASTRHWDGVSQRRRNQATGRCSASSIVAEWNSTRQSQE